MTRHIFAGFGFGPIQSGLMVSEAFKSGRFERLAVAEIDADLVAAVRLNHGCYAVNVAHQTGIDVETVEGLEIYNPRVEQDRTQFLEVLSQATEIVTSLPSVAFYSQGPCSVASLIAQALDTNRAQATIVYTAENNNHAAETLQACVQAQHGPLEPTRVQFLNTVIGKMSQVVTDPEQMARQGLQPMAPGLNRAFLVESFNRILVTRTTLPGFRPGIDVFSEKADLIPFEEAKLYGHNAIHALLAYLGAMQGYTAMSELTCNESLMGIARRAFFNESGASLIKKYGHLNDELFTEQGYTAFAEDLLTRMTNPHLADAVDRAGRDVVRKLGLSDRLYGTMRLALEYGIQPAHMAMGAGAALLYLQSHAEQCSVPGELRFSMESPVEESQIRQLLHWLWKDTTCDHTDTLVTLTHQAVNQLISDHADL
jgi:mannitol-1-phosphate 5-dehydrogenase